MSHESVKLRQAAIEAQVNRIVGRIGTFLLSAIAAIAPMIHVVDETFTPVRLGAVLGVLILLHVMWYRRFVFRREFVLYTAFLAYMFLSLLWAPDLLLGMNTLLPALDFVLILILFAALVTYHDVETVLAGILGGFLIGAAFYTMTQGFPFRYPHDFSYNAVAGMYLFGLFITLVLACSSRFKLVSLLIGPILLVHIAATTSIKTNLGILLGSAAAALMYFGNSLSLLRRNAVPIAVVVAVLTYAAASNDAVVEKVHAGIERVALGVEILSAREERPSGTSFARREHWLAEGLSGWATNPLFGHGVEAFRADYGITSHATPVDLLYNTGVIGLVLFYAIFVSIAWRLLRARGSSPVALRALMFAAFVCYLSITFSATMHYDGFLAVFIAVSTSLLTKRSRQPAVARVSPSTAYA